MQYRNIVVLTGAGISAESGIKTFRDSNGLWEEHRVEDVATPEGFARNPELVYQFYNLRRAQLKQNDIKPNAAHLALAEFEQRHVSMGGRFKLITQNVDNLHQRAGSLNLLTLHGQLQSVLCLKSGKAQTWTSDLTGQDRCSCCQPPSAMRPDIGWFGEVPYGLDECFERVSESDLFISIGTSGKVYPAAGFMSVAKMAGAHTVELNMEQTSHAFDEGVYGPASKVVVEYLKSIRI